MKLDNLLLQADPAAESQPANNGEGGNDWLTDYRTQEDWVRDMARLRRAASRYGRDEKMETLMDEMEAAILAGQDEIRRWCAANALTLIDECVRVDGAGLLMAGDELMDEARGLFEFRGKADEAVFA